MFPLESFLTLICIRRISCQANILKEINYQGRSKKESSLILMSLIFPVFVHPWYFNGTCYGWVTPHPKLTLSSPEENHVKGIREAMAEFETLTCINFVKRKTERDYLIIRSADGWVERLMSKLFLQSFFDSSLFTSCVTLKRKNVWI